jgi:hypothetical protein
MSAIVIYPAAFKDVSSQAVAAFAPLSTAGADVIPLLPAAVADTSSDFSQDTSPVAALRTIRVAATQSAQSLSDAEDSLTALRTREAEMAERSRAISAASQDLGAQMERLIDETRRMVSYLRTERMV